MFGEGPQEEMEERPYNKKRGSTIIGHYPSVYANKKGAFLVGLAPFF